MPDHPEALFLLRFRRSVDEVAAALARGVSANDAGAARDEALLVLCRMLFLSFIESNGWLAGDRQFLRHRFDQAVEQQQNFFDTALAPLFFGSLNTPIAERAWAAGRLGAIPYLNSGLFAPSPFERRHVDLHLSNEVMGRAVVETFGAFAFQITREPGTACIDADMLGRVFETLMERGERVTSGSYYTPRAVASALAGAAIAERLGPDATEAALERIAVLDPSCGSGAILLAMLNALAERWRTATGRPADIRRIVATALYGVDLKPEAVRICELRLWLAVAAADGSADEVRPLPNLDRNIMHGNALLSPIDVRRDVREHIYSVWRNGLRWQDALLRRYRTASHSERIALGQALRSIDDQLAADLLRIDIAEGAERAPDRNFAHEVHFAPVLANGGFDVVIGNPPWLRAASIPADERRLLATRYAWFRAAPSSVEAPRQSDLSVAFFERAMQLVRPDGVVAMLMPARIATADYGAALRRAVRPEVAAIADWSAPASPHRAWFDADVEALTILVRCGMQARRGQVGRVLAAAPNRAWTTLHGTSVWTIAPQRVLTVLRRLYEAYPPLQRALQRRPLMGVKTGQNQRFFLAGSQLHGDHVTAPDGVDVPFSALCRCVRGRDVRRWQILRSEWLLWPRGHEHSPWLERLAERRGIPPAALRLAYARSAHVGLRVAWKDISRGMAAVVMPATVDVGDHPVPLVPNQTLYSLSARTLAEAHTIAAVLNSTIAGALLLALAERVKDAHYRYFARTTALLPWPDLGSANDALARLSVVAHEGADVAEQIDAVVADAYRVTPKELLQLRRYVVERLR